MGKHRAIPQHSLRARTVIGGAVASGALLLCAPAGMALAHRDNGGNNGTTGPAAPTAKLQTSRNADENRDLATLFSKIPPSVLIALETKAATDPGLAKLLGKFACVQTASCA